MRIPHFRTVAIVLAAGIGLGGCASYSPYGYGGGVSVGYGNSGYYDPYYGGYSSYGSGYGYGYSPYGWYDGYYYPGAGSYVYDRYRRPYYWNDLHRRYWIVRRKDPSVREVWTDFAREHATGNGTTQVEPSATTSTLERATTSRADRARTRRIERRSRPVVDRTSRIERRLESESSEPVRGRRPATRQRPAAQP